MVKFSVCLNRRVFVKVPLSQSIDKIHFQLKFIFFLFLVDGGASHEYRQHMLVSRNKKNISLYPFYLELSKVFSLYNTRTMRKIRRIKKNYSVKILLGITSDPSIPGLVTVRFH